MRVNDVTLLSRNESGGNQSDSGRQSIPDGIDDSSLPF
jgi:hypothetical protein